jgi:hypothetical protein
MGGTYPCAARLGRCAPQARRDQPGGTRARDAAIAAIAPILSDTISEIGAERVRQALPVIREMRVRLEDDSGG